MGINTDIKMLNRRLYVPITLGDVHSTYVRVRPEDALVVTFRDRFDIASGKVIDGESAERIAGHEIASIFGKMMQGENVSINRIPRHNTTTDEG